MKRIILAFAATLFAGHAFAADLLKAPPIALPVCSTSFCTGFYVGGGLDGNGTNADIIGSGLTGSVFAGGAIPTINAGYQFWNGSIFLAGEASVGYQVSTGVAINGVSTNQQGMIAIEELQVGGKLSGLLGTGAAPIAIPGPLSADLISLYVAAGVAEEPHATAFETGAGAKFVLGANAMLDLGYRYVPFRSTTGDLTVKADNLIRVRFDYIFK